MTILAPSPLRLVSLWRDVIRPKEHGSWSLALEPIALGLLVAPSWAGASLAAALVAGFFARRPLRMVALEHRRERRRAAWEALAACAVPALAGSAGAVALGGSGWVAWLLPVAGAGAVFLCFDLRGEGREEVAELIGAGAFALVPAALAVLGGLPAEAAASLALLMLGRAVPSVATVRAYLRAAKTGTRRDAFALGAAFVALAAGVALVRRGMAPAFAAIALGVLAGRTVAWLVVVRPSWRASRIGMIEAVLGLAFVLGLALAWR